MMKVGFRMPPAERAAALATGSVPVAEVIEPCSLVVGDTISFPGFRKVRYRVKARHYDSQAEKGQPNWILDLEMLP